MNEIIFSIEEAPEGGFIAHALGVPIITEADTHEELQNNIRDALLCHFDNKNDIPKIVRLHFVKEEFLTL